MSLLHQYSKMKLTKWTQSCVFVIAAVFFQAFVALTQVKAGSKMLLK